MAPPLLRYSFAFVLAASLIGQTTAQRPIKLDDLARFHDVGAPEVSPDGKWIAYTVSSVEKEADKRDTDLWMVSWDGKQQVRLTSTTMTMPITASAYQVASTEVVRDPTSWVTARQAMKQLAPTRIVASARADRCSAFPCPY